MRTIEQTGQFKRDYKREAKGLHRCWQQIELTGFVVNELSALMAAKNSVEGAARNRIFSRRRLRRTYAAAFKLDASPFPVLS